MLNAIIIDNNKKDVTLLEENLNSIQVVKAFNTGNIDGDELKQLDLDIIFVNIDSPQCVNMELIQLIINDKITTQIVYITMDEPLENDILYIRKPFNNNDLLKLEETLLDKKEGNQAEYVKVCMFKYFHFKNKDEKFYNVKWRTAKSKELLVYFMQHHKEIVRKDVLVELLWPNTIVEKAYDSLYATIYYLRKLLKDLDINITINNTVNGYEVHLDQVVIDVILFEENVEELESLLDSESDKDVILKKYKALQELYTGEYLEEESYVWKEHKKAEYSIKFLAISQKVIDLLFEQEDYTEAILLALNLQKHYLYMDYPYFTLMKLYHKFGDPYHVEQQYIKLKEMLDAEFNSKPSTKIKAWYQDWIKVQNV